MAPIKSQSVASVKAIIGLTRTQEKMARKVGMKQTTVAVVLAGIPDLEPVLEVPGKLVNVMTGA